MQAPGVTGAALTLRAAICAGWQADVYFGRTPNVEPCTEWGCPGAAGAGRVRGWARLPHVVHRLHRQQHGQDVHQLAVVHAVDERADGHRVVGLEHVPARARGRPRALSQRHVTTRLTA